MSFTCTIVSTHSAVPSSADLERLNILCFDSECPWRNAASSAIAKQVQLANVAIRESGDQIDPNIPDSMGSAVAGTAAPNSQLSTSGGGGGADRLHQESIGGDFCVSAGDLMSLRSDDSPAL